MANITLRSVKGSALTFQEADDNFTNLAAASLPTGGNSGQVLAKTSASNYDVSFVDASVLQGTTGFTGSQGVQGDVGFTGSQGVQGPVGFTGSQGDVGFTGSQGVQGPVGFTGSQGVQGDVGFTGSQGVQGDVGFTGSQGPIGFTGSAGINGINNLTDVTITSVATDDVLVYNGTVWVNSPIIGDISIALDAINGV
jgi:hypothetical protein